MTSIVFESKQKIQKVQTNSFALGIIIENDLKSRSF